MQKIKIIFNPQPTPDRLKEKPHPFSREGLGVGFIY
jgi:hypothetical protein